MGGTKDNLGTVDRKKKQKTFNPVWRAVSTQASINGEILVKDASEDGSQIQEVHHNISSNSSDAQLVMEIAEAVNEGPDLTLSSSALQDNIKDRTLEGAPVTSGEKHSLSLEVGASVIRFIKGKERSTQRQIEKLMGVKIILPSSKKEDSVVIEGISIDSITKASQRIQAIIDEAVHSPSIDYSHFVLLPLAIQQELVDKLVNFQNTILGINEACLDDNVDSDSNEDTSDNKDKEQWVDKESNVAVKLKVGNDNECVEVDITSFPLVSYAPKASRASTFPGLGIDKSIFIKPKTFHLTVLMLMLWNRDRVNAATKVLKSISSKVMDALDNRPVFVRLKGVNCLRGSSDKARVLYAPVEEIGDSHRLFRAAQVITDAFYDAGLVLKGDYDKKLKVDENCKYFLNNCIVGYQHKRYNLSFNLKKCISLHKGKKRVDNFDARGIFKQFGSKEWGGYLIREAHLSQRFVFDESGYYHCCASIPFLESMQVD